MEIQELQLDAYLSGKIEKLVREMTRMSLENPKERIFMARFALASLEASRKRARAEKKGNHIPTFLIASITSRCNLHCAGCYSRHNHACSDEAPAAQLTAQEWGRIFSEAKESGISFVLMAGGEPLLRRDVIEAAGNYPDILFPVFTNGTLLNDDYITLFEKKRNLLPILSIEGSRELTDGRRGEGVYANLKHTMELLRAHQLLFGTSITVTTENMQEVTSPAFLHDLRSSGCRAVIYVEYVPVTEKSRTLAPGDAERDYLQSQLSDLRRNEADMVFLSFPGDEKNLGGCLAAGRGFFHINSHGGAEPCPFSPFSDCNVKDTSLQQAMASPFFSALREQHIMQAAHEGGCVLFEERDAVERILSNQS